MGSVARGDDRGALIMDARRRLKLFSLNCGLLHVPLYAYSPPPKTGPFTGTGIDPSLGPAR